MREKTGKIVQCKQCQKNFYLPKWRQKRKSKTNSCSVECYHKSTIGRRASKITKMRQSIALKGRIPKPMSEETKQKISKSKKGKRGFLHNCWKTGETKHKLGYVLIHKFKHPFAIKTGYIRRSRLVMEQWLRKHKPNHPALIKIKGKKYLRKGWIVHHKGIKYPIKSVKNRQDNRLENLQLFPNTSKHLKFHAFLRKKLRRTLPRQLLSKNCI